jgi:glycosyltransferase involved in cell wall biosynthesis
MSRRIIVVDDGSTDQTLALRGNMPQASFMVTKPGAAAARIKLSHESEIIFVA